MRMRAATVVAVLVAFLATLGPTETTAHAAKRTNRTAIARKHAAKAAKLAAKNKCRAAVVHFTKAYKVLSDPALLFNRAECYRKLGKKQQAVDDYQAFLDAVPDAPNRASIEARIATLGRGAAKPGRSAPAGDTAQPDEDLGLAGVGQRRQQPGQAERWADLPPAASPPQTPASSAARAPLESPAVDLTAKAAPPEPAEPESSHTWLWIGTAVVVAGVAAVAGYHYWPRQKTDVPATPLGNYAF